MIVLDRRLGACKKLEKGDPLMKTWHDHVDPQLGFRYNSAWAPEGVTQLANQASREEDCM